METFGKLSVRVFINDRIDQHGRVSGSWKTLKTWWLHRENVETTIQQFAQANPELDFDKYSLRTTFVVSEDIR